MGVLLQIYACPIYETMDTAWGRKQEGTWSIFNFLEHFVTRVIYLALTTFVAALLPFFVSATLYIAYFVSSLPPYPTPTPNQPPCSTFQSIGVPGVEVSSADVAGTHIDLCSIMYSRCSRCSALHSVVLVLLHSLLPLRKDKEMVHALVLR